MFILQIDKILKSIRWPQIFSIYSQENISSFKNDEHISGDVDSNILQNLMKEIQDIGWDRFVS